ncbi:MAG: nitroreductase family protein [Prevotella sp.]|nr:nitroreductase family protein [Prevotella sp.]
MSLEEILQHRRAVRKYDAEKALDPEKVKECIRLATLAPTSSNMQLWEAYHITDPEVLKKMAVACLNQGSAKTCKEMVVFVTRQDQWKRHAQAVLEANIAEINANSPEDRKAHRIELQKKYYAQLMPLTYKRCFGLLGLLRVIISQVVGLFRPVPRQESEAQMNTVVHKSCALVVQTFMLAMSEQGYDTCPLEGFDSLLVKRALHLPHDCGINMVITCGYRAPGGVRGERFRLPLKEFYHRI